MGHLVCQTDLNLKLPASLGYYTRFSSTCMELDFLHSLFLPTLDRKGKSKERGNERNLSLSPFNNVITGLRHGAAFTHDEIELTSECKGPLLLQTSLVVKSIKGISKHITWCIISRCWPTLSAPLFSSNSNGWAAGESLQDKQITECHGPRATQLHSQTSPTKAAHLTHVGHRLFQWMSL